jgi:hypothetical protein
MSCVQAPPNEGPLHCANTHHCPTFEVAKVSKTLCNDGKNKEVVLHVNATIEFAFAIMKKMLMMKKLFFYHDIYNRG